MTILHLIFTPGGKTLIESFLQQIFCGGQSLQLPVNIQQFTTDGPGRNFSFTVAHYSLCRQK